MAPLTLLFALGALLSPSALAVPAKPGRTHRAGPNIASHWQHVGPSSASDEMNITFVLKSKDYDGLTAKMDQIALEGGEWLTVEELANYVGPADESKAAIEAAVKSSLGASEFSYSATGDKLTVKTTVEAASKVHLLATFSHPLISRINPYVLPFHSIVLRLRIQAVLGGRQRLCSPYHGLHYSWSSHRPCRRRLPHRHFCRRSSRQRLPRFGGPGCRYWPSMQLADVLSRYVSIQLV